MFLLCVLRRVRLPRYGAARPFLLCPLPLGPWLVFRGDVLFWCTGTDGHRARRHSWVSVLVRAHCVLLTHMNE